LSNNKGGHVILLNSIEVYMILLHYINGTKNICKCKKYYWHILGKITERILPKEIILTWLAFKVFRKFPRLFTIPCQWAIKARWASVFATERDDPLTRLALDVLGAYLVTYQQWCLKRMIFQGNVKCINWKKKSYHLKACVIDQFVESRN